jgi:hypothetical protein
MAENNNYFLNLFNGSKADKLTSINKFVLNLRDSKYFINPEFFFTKFCSYNLCISDIELFSRDFLRLRRLEYINFVERTEQCIIDNCAAVLSKFNLIYYSHDDNDIIKLIAELLK